MFFPELTHQATKLHVHLVRQVFEALLFVSKVGFFRLPQVGGLLTPRVQTVLVYFTQVLLLHLVLQSLQFLRVLVVFLVGHEVADIQFFGDNLVRVVVRVR